MHPLRRFLALAGAERRLLLEAMIALAMARVLFAALPFTTAMRWSGLRTVAGGDADPGSSGVEPEGILVARALSWAIPRVAHRLPFRAVCLQQAMACAIMLRRRQLPVVVRFGVYKEPGGATEAHAWAICGGMVVTGARGMERYTPIAAFSP
ncbi:MAG: lasso peptide biosynthesis B2 protein [Alphaproteobacteria bacterium]|nr:lasso peptide biosynthesis B2 protein [Alphaproteobacteria bacterium]